MSKLKEDVAHRQIEAKVTKAIKAAGHKKEYVIYSAYESDDDDVPLDNLDEVAVKGKVVLVGYIDDYWGGKRSKEYRSPVLENPTWLEVTVHANVMIKTVRDTHHVFLEGLDLTKEEHDGFKVYEFVMGS